ncbi:MAG: ATP-dependent RNA helicase RhlE [Limisphaerales bacterium]|jgi:ATP-dependent RNA helicase RhlE
MGFRTPTPIQEEAIPIIMDGKDIIACAQTGTGKTAAYLLPSIDSITRGERGFIHTLIIAPTRELAVQIDEQIQGFGYFTDTLSSPVYGGGDGVAWEVQKRALTKGADIVVATPGRLISHLNMGYVNFAKVRHFILDEADRMLDMGFYDDIIKISNYLPKERQSLLFSATMPKKIRDLATTLLNDPAEISIAISKPAEGILQAAYLVYDNDKLALLSKLLRDKELPTIIVFASRKIAVKNLAKDLRGQGFNARGMHSDLTQDERLAVMNDFANRKVQILVATDIVSRGIDIENINLVVNWDIPQDPEDYVHRIGRTARADTTGVGLTFINDDDQYRFANIEKLIEKTINKLPLPPEIPEGPAYNPNKKGGRSGGRGGYKGGRSGGKSGGYKGGNRSGGSSGGRNFNKGGGSRGGSSKG